MRKILVLTMGGTIDGKAYPHNEAQYPAFPELRDDNPSYRVLEDLALDQDIELKQIKISNKDSKDLTQDDINALENHIATRGFERIIVTMGTDAMIPTARSMRESILKETTCPILFTGAIWPLDNGPEKSDGFENLHRALFKNIKDLDPDFFIVMGDVFAPAHQVEKDFEKKKFYKID